MEKKTQIVRSIITKTKHMIKVSKINLDKTDSIHFPDSETEKVALSVNNYLVKPT